MILSEVISHINPWMASPFIFAIGVAMLYVRWPVIRFSSIFVLACALLLAVPPGDPDNWWMAVFEVLLGSLLLCLFRPRWFRERKNRDSESRLQFGLRDLLIAAGVFGLCLSLVLRAYLYRAEQSAFAEMVDPILQNFTSSVAFENGQVQMLATNILSRHGDPLFEKARASGLSHWRASQEGSKAFADADLASLVNTHQAIRFLDLRQSEVTPGGLANLEKLQSLEGLTLDPLQSTPDGIEFLKRLTNLQLLSLGTTGSDGEVLDSLQQALPNCEIHFTAQDANE